MFKLNKGGSSRYADPATARENIEETLRGIDLAADIGAPRIRVFGAKIPKDVTGEETIKRVAEALRSVADHARERGIVVCMETNDDWCNPEYVSEVMRTMDQTSSRS